MQILSSRPWLFRSALVALATAIVLPAVPSSQRDADRELAVDGHRSLGSDREISEILKIFYQPTEEDRAFLAGLAELGEHMGVFAATTEALYRSRGWFDAEDLARLEEEVGLETLHRAVLAALDSDGSFLLRGGTTAELHATILLDPRVHVRAELFSDWEEDAREVEDGLRVLRSCTDGWTYLEDEEGQLIARRVDFAAALLRARVKDLSALRETPGSSTGVSAEDVKRLAEVLRLPRGPERDGLLRAERDSIEKRVESMREVLFFTRLAHDAEGWFRWRDELDSKAAALLEEVRVWRPDNDEGKDLPRNIRSRTKTDRRQWTLRLAKEGLSYDPFDAELAYAAGWMADIVTQKIEAASYFDRFLALRGIRVHEDRNWRKRELTEEEKHAIFKVQEFSEEQRGG